MHIAFDAKRAFLNNTGLGNYSRTMINALTRMFPDNRYTLYTTSEGDNRHFSTPMGCMLRTPDARLSGRLKGYWRIRDITRMLAKDQVDLYHGLSNEIPLGLERSGIKSVVTIHDLIFKRHPELYPLADRMIYDRKTRHAVKNANSIVAVSRQTGSDLIDLMDADPSKIHVIGQGCNPWFYNEADDESKKAISEKYNLPEDYLLYVGTIEERKNLLSIIRAIHEYGIDIPLVAAGRKTSYFGKIRKYMDDNKVGNVHFLHEIDNPDLPAIYQQASVFIYPSRYEGFGIPILEALNSGTPVITSKGGCLEETAGKGGLLVDPGDVEQLGFSIRKILEDTGLQNELIEAGKAHALDFREEKIIPELFEVYKKCLS